MINKQILMRSRTVCEPVITNKLNMGLGIVYPMGNEVCDSKIWVRPTTFKLERSCGLARQGPLRGTALAATQGTTDRVEAVPDKSTDSWHGVPGAVAPESAGQQLVELPPAWIEVNTNQRVASIQLRTPEPPTDSLRHPTH